MCCSSPAQKELWWLKLSELIRVERSHSPAGASINVTYFDNATNFEHVSIYNIYNICNIYNIYTVLNILYPLEILNSGTLGH